MNSSEPTFVTLRSGQVLPVEAIKLALDLEARGLHLRVDGEGLSIGPRVHLTEADRQQIRLYRDELLVIASYDVDVVQ